jgi:hypothetical protein
MAQKNYISNKKCPICGGDKYCELHLFASIDLNNNSFEGFLEKQSREFISEIEERFKDWHENPDNMPVLKDPDLQKLFDNSELVEGEVIFDNLYEYIISILENINLYFMDASPEEEDCTKPGDGDVIHNWYSMAKGLFRHYLSSDGDDIHKWYSSSFLDDYYEFKAKYKRALQPTGFISMGALPPNHPIFKEGVQLFTVRAAPKQDPNSIRYNVKYGKEIE